MSNLLPSQAESQVQSQNAVPGQPQQAPAENPLDQLRDIHLPDQIDQFPYAPGWWMLLALLLIAIAFYLFHLYKKQRALRLLKPARAEINQLRSLPQDQLNAHSIAKLSALLKRVCLIYFPRRSVASLNGHSWLNFLNDQAGCTQTKSFFSDADIQLFSKAAYQANPEIEKPDWIRLLLSSENCIEVIIRASANNKLAMTQTDGSPSQLLSQTQPGSRL